MWGLMAPTSVNAPSQAWKKWLEYILKEKSMFFKSAALVYENGVTAAASNGFHVSSSELEIVKRIFHGAKPERIIVNDVTYCVKSIENNHVIAFNGSKYLVISKSQQMFVFGLCTSRMRSTDASHFIGRVANSLSEKAY
ncbi:uncharacterized protein LOC141908175 [Tubulanus polymorphus]|uniref:uncharacterized protein LOC141908175 n=1 Tax=Tubulanus polymorphus TaxID=672921 RepID=UPI003DA2C1AE